MTPPVRLRRLRWWDVERLADVEQELFAGDPWSAETFWSELAAGSARWYVVAEEEPDRLLGYAGLSCSPRAAGGDAEVMTVGVVPQAQGRGVGRVLVAALADEARERAAGRLLLEARTDNAPALALYESMGFARVAVRESYYPAGPGSLAIDAVVMALTLGPTAEPEQAHAADSLPR